MGCTVFWQCKIYHWDNSVRLLAMPMHTDLRFIFQVECDFFSYYFRMVWFPVYTKGRPFDSEGGGAGKFYRDRLFSA